MGNHKAQGQPQSPGMILKIHVLQFRATTKPRGRPRSPGVISKLHVLLIWATSKPRGDHEAPEWSRSSMCCKFGRPRSPGGDHEAPEWSRSSMCCKFGRPRSPGATTKPRSDLEAPCIENLAKFGKIGRPRSPGVTTKPWSHFVCILISIQAERRSCPHFWGRVLTDEANWTSDTNFLSRRIHVHDFDIDFQNLHMEFEKNHIDTLHYRWSYIFSLISLNLQQKQDRRSWFWSCTTERGTCKESSSLQRISKTVHSSPRSRKPVLKCGNHSFAIGGRRSCSYRYTLKILRKILKDSHLA